MHHRKRTHFPCNMENASFFVAIHACVPGNKILSMPHISIIILFHSGCYARYCFKISPINSISSGFRSRIQFSSPFLFFSRLAAICSNPRLIKSASRILFSRTGTSCADAACPDSVAPDETDATPGVFSDTVMRPLFLRFSLRPEEAVAADCTEGTDCTAGSSSGSTRPILPARSTRRLTLRSAHKEAYGADYKYPADIEWMS